MSNSRERLDMENDAKRGSHISFGNQHGGMYLSRRALTWLGVSFVATVVVIALLVHFLAPCPGGGGRSLETSDDASAVTDGSGGGDSSTSTPPRALNLRLPRSVRPLHYELRLQPFLAEGNFTFHGRVSIVIECLQDETQAITLHALNISVPSQTVELVEGDRQKIGVSKQTEDAERQFLIFDLEKPLRKGKNYTLSMDFEGPLLEVLYGFYRSKDGDKWMATTQFQPTDARRAFPCFDEPGFKATFDVSLVRPPNMMSLSNMPLASDAGKTTPDGWVIDHYETTKNMSTYLLAFVVTDFAYQENATARVKFRVYSRKEAINQTDYALKTGPAVLNFYEQFFNVKYPLPKQDMIAIPDFGAGAMENWGLITYRETALLFDPKISASKNRQRVAVVIAHELAHQWFGNLVTPLWWEDLWLNEGFASYVEFLGVNHVHPQWKMLDQFVVDDLQVVFDMDCLKSSHPVSVRVDNPDQINEIFDHISYAKGSSILRMMHNFLGDIVFREAVTNYLNDKEFDNAVQDDLWQHLTTTAHKHGQKNINVKYIMDTWTIQTGYPVVTVKRIDEQTLELKQEQFLLNPGNTTQDITWEIPITFTTKSISDFSNTIPQKWMHKNQDTITLSVADKVPPSSEWIIINVKQTGYYRVNYDTQNWQKIIEQLNTDHKVINPLNRAQIVNDALNLARAGQLDYEIALNTTQYLTAERDYVPFKAALVTIEYIDSMLSKTAAYGKWMNYMLSRISPIYDFIKFEDDSVQIEGGYDDSNHLPSLIRAMIVKHACSLQMSSCLNSSMVAFKAWMEKNESISPNLKMAVICSALQKGGITEWEFVWQQYLKSNVGSEKITFLSALGCIKEPWIISKYLDMALTSSDIRTQDVSTVIGSVANNKVGRIFAYNFVRNKWPELKNKFQSGAFTLSKIVQSAMKNLNTPFELQEVKSFLHLRKEELASSERAMRQIVEETEANVDWMENNYKPIKDWLERTVK